MQYCVIIKPVEFMELKEIKEKINTLKEKLANIGRSL